jgi:predicted nucleic acid-binding protein
MQRVVVDTDVISFCFRNDTRFSNYATAIAGKQLVMSFMTLAELRLWQELRNWSAKRRDNFFIELDKHYLVYPVDRNLCFMWAELKALSIQQGRVLQTADAWVAATARVLDVPLVTHNKKDFEYLPGITVISFPTN